MNREEQEKLWKRTGTTPEDIQASLAMDIWRCANHAGLYETQDVFENLARFYAENHNIYSPEEILQFGEVVEELPYERSNGHRLIGELSQYLDGDHKYYCQESEFDSTIDSVMDTHLQSLNPTQKYALASSLVYHNSVVPNGLAEQARDYAKREIAREEVFMLYNPKAD